MKTFHIEITSQSDEQEVTDILHDLQNKGLIKFNENTGLEGDGKPVPATEDQVQEIIEEAELGPYYSDKEAKNILNL